MPRGGVWLVAQFVVLGEHPTGKLEMGVYNTLDHSGWRAVKTPSSHHRGDVSLRFGSVWSRLADISAVPFALASNGQQKYICDA
jgi:hypothetical protein